MPFITTHTHTVGIHLLYVVHYADYIHALCTQHTHTYLYVGVAVSISRNVCFVVNSMRTHEYTYTLFLCNV